MKPRALVLFSGGKDSVYSLESSLNSYTIVSLISFISSKGSVQMTDGPEIEKGLLSNLISLFPFPHQNIVIGNEDDYLEQIVSMVGKIVEKEKIEVIITGDLNHPDGIDKVIHEKLGIKCISPANDFLQEFGAEAYLQDFENKKISFILSGIRNNYIPSIYIGKPFNKEVIEELQKNNVDITGEDGEFQTLVVSTPLMKEKILVNSFKLKTATGRDKNGHIYTFMEDVNYSLVENTNTI